MGHEAYVKKTPKKYKDLVELLIDHSYPQYKYITNLDGKILVDFLLYYETQVVCGTR